jgi:hypothetical protein
MLKILSSLILFSSFSAFAGVLANKATGELVEFNINQEKKIVEVISHAREIEDMTLKLIAIKPIKHTIEAYPGTKAYCNFSMDGSSLTDTENYVWCLLTPVLNFGSLPIAATETLALPFKATANMVKNQTAKKDVTLLNEVIFTESYISVSNKRFKRILEIL